MYLYVGAQSWLAFFYSFPLFLLVATDRCGQLNGLKMWFIAPIHASIEQRVWAFFVSLPSIGSLSGSVSRAPSARVNEARVQIISIDTATSLTLGLA